MIAHDGILRLNTLLAQRGFAMNAHRPPLLALISLLGTLGLAALSGMSAPALAADGPYQISGRFALGGEGGWDYLSVDPATHLLYVSRADRVIVVDTTTGRSVGRSPIRPACTASRLRRISGAASSAAGRRTSSRCSISRAAPCSRASRRATGRTRSCMSRRPSACSPSTAAARAPVSSMPGATVWWQPSRSAASPNSRAPTALASSM